MNKKILIFLLCFGFIACESKSPDLVLEGKIFGLKKGKIFLQRVKDSAIINIDSVEFYNTNLFRFERQLDYPEIMYLQLQKDTINPEDNFVAFFADKGKVNVNAALNQFMFADIKANYANQKEFNTYSKNLKRFGDQKLDLIKAEMEARSTNDEARLDSVNKAYDRMNKRRYLYTINFAINHPDLEVSPYVLLNQAQYIRKSYLDSVYQKLDHKVQKSYYGRKLNNLIMNPRKD
jgi:hypothetical protein